jgi:hypothetical protein
MRSPHFSCQQELPDDNPLDSHLYSHLSLDHTRAPSFVPKMLVPQPPSFHTALCYCRRLHDAPRRSQVYGQCASWRAGYRMALNIPLEESATLYHLAKGFHSALPYCSGMIGRDDQCESVLTGVNQPEGSCVSRYRW